MQPLVTVIIPTYNRAPTIARSIDSVLKQTYENIELIIVDDGSSDSTIKIVKSYHNEKIKLICLDKHSGANTARNRGIYAAKGEYIAFQDSDDEWLKDKLEIQLSYMMKTGRKVCYCPYILNGDEGKRIIPSQMGNKELYERKIIDILRKKNVVSTQTLVIHKEVTEKEGVFDEDLNRLQDYEFIIRLCQHYEIGYIDKPLVNVYRMPNSISNNKLALADAYKKILIKHSSFIDIETFLHSYLFNSEWYDNKKIYWEYLYEIIEKLKLKGTKEIVDQENRAKRYMLKWYAFFKSNIIDKKFAIYGAGYYGKEVYRTLKRIGIMPEYFLVTQCQKETRIDQTSVLELSNKIDNKLPIIIAVNKETQEEVINNLMSIGLENYFIYPFC